MRKFVSLAIGMLIGLVGWWGVSAFLATPATTSRGEGKPASAPGRAPPPLAPAVKSDAPAERGARAAREADPAKGSAEAVAPSGPKLHGTIVGVDEANVEHKELDGRFKLHWMEKREPHSLDVVVAKGRFATDAPHVEAIGVDDVILGERIGRLADFEIDVPASGEVALRVKLVPAAALKVVDAATRTVLDDAEVWYDLEATRGPNRLAPRLEDDAQRVVAAARSPIVLPPIEGTPRYWVHVKGFAWSLIEVQHLVGGEREVPLIRGGGLTLRFLQKPERDDLQVVVRNGTASLTFRAAVTDPVRELVDVAPGHCEVEVTIEQARTVVARAECDVVAGAVAHVELALGDVASQPKVARVPFRGVVASADPRLTMQLFALLSSLDPAQRVTGPDRFVQRPVVRDPANDGEWSFDFGTIVPGRKLVTIQPLQVHQIFEVGAQGLVDARIVLPTLGEVEVAVTDEESGAAIESAGVTWRSANHPMADDDVPQSAATRGDPPVARFLAPLGRITVSCWPDTYSTGEKELEVLTSLQRVSIAVRHEQYVRVLFKQGTSVIPIDPGSMEFALLDGDGRNHQIGWAKEGDTGALKLIVDKAGDYTLRFPKLTGFRTPDDRAVRVESGGTAEVEVALELQ